MIGKGGGEEDLWLDLAWSVVVFVQNEQALSERDHRISSLTTQSEKKDAEIESLCISRDQMVLEVQRLSSAVEQYRGKLAQYGAIMGPMHDLNLDLDKVSNRSTWIGNVV